MKAKTKEPKNMRSCGYGFRIVRERWYHEIVDLFNGKAFDKNLAGGPTGLKVGSITFDLVISPSGELVASLPNAELSGKPVGNVICDSLPIQQNRLDA
jgi:hypothetical protein